MKPANLVPTPAPGTAITGAHAWDPHPQLRRGLLAVGEGGEVLQEVLLGQAPHANVPVSPPHRNPITPLDKTISQVPAHYRAPGLCPDSGARLSTLDSVPGKVPKKEKSQTRRKTLHV